MHAEFGSLYIKAWIHSIARIVGMTALVILVLCLWSRNHGLESMEAPAYCF